MASSAYGSAIDTELNSLSINTVAEVATFRSLPRRQCSAKSGTGVNDFQTLHDAIASPKVWISRKRIRHDSLRLLREGAL